MLLTWKKRRLASLKTWSASDLCTRLDEPGVAIDVDALVDYSNTPETPDQLEIEAELASRDLRGARLLHIGVGNSALAARLLPRCAGIDGHTVSEAERRHGESLGLAGYRVELVNKYAREFLRCVTPGYAFIIDNNTASFACCIYHFANLIDNYRWALAPGGELLTHQRGMHWVAEDRRWKMTFDDLETLGQRFGMTARRIGQVYSLRRD